MTIPTQHSLSDPAFSHGIDRGFLTSVTRLSGILSLVISLAAGGLGHWRESLGLLIGFLWAFVNMALLRELLELAIHSVKDPNIKRKVMLLCFLKFPVIYLVGYFILRSRFFGIAGILTGFTLFVAATLFFWMRRSAKPEF